MPNKPMPRPNMSAWFKSRIEWHTHGMLAGRSAPLPRNVARVIGDVDKRDIVVVMQDGTEYAWTGGEFSARKVNGCYPPKMPVPVTTPRITVVKEKD